MLSMRHERYDYTIPATTPVPKPETAKPRASMHPLLHAILQMAIVYVVVYAVCFAVEGAIRLQYGVGSVTAIEKQYADRGQRAKAMVARQKRIDMMTENVLYDIYLTVVLFGTPVAMAFIIIHHIRLANRLMGRFWKPVRWWLVGFTVMLGSGMTIFVGPFVKAQQFYDRISPAELIQRLR